MLVQLTMGTFGLVFFFFFSFPLLLPVHRDKLNSMIQELSTAVAGVKHEQEYMEVREKVHRSSE